MSKIKGVFPPLVTMFDEERKIDFESMKKHIDFLIEKGVTGISILGTSGEFFSLSNEEKRFLIDNVLEHVNNRIKVIVGVGDTNSNEIFEFLEYTENKNIEALLVITPYYAIYDEDSMVKYYKDIASKTSTDIIIYNFPALSGFDFKASIVEQIISECKNVVGIKETVDDIEHLKEMLKLKEKNKDFSVICAFENQAYDALNYGADGFINATANFAPEFTVNTYKYFNEKNEKLLVENFENMKKAMKIYSYSQPLLLACKQAVYQRVLKKDCFEKLPAYSLDSKSKDEIKQHLEELGIL